jgi:hypothetical protein
VHAAVSRHTRVLKVVTTRVRRRDEVPTHGPMRTTGWKSAG